jgi:hypothetical protein
MLKSKYEKGFDFQFRLKEIEAKLGNLKKESQ